MSIRYIKDGENLFSSGWYSKHLLRNSYLFLPPHTIAAFLVNCPDAPRMFVTSTLSTPILPKIGLKNKQHYNIDIICAAFVEGNYCKSPEPK